MLETSEKFRVQRNLRQRRPRRARGHLERRAGRLHPGRQHQRQSAVRRRHEFRASAQPALAAIPPGVTTDLACDPRTYHSTLDMGAYETRFGFGFSDSVNGQASGGSA